MSDILDKIYKTIEDRSNNPIKNSYTNYLLDNGIDKICKKVGEEATEVVIASKNSEKDLFVGEVADLTFHVLVLLYEKGCSLQDVIEVLEKRHLVNGNKKKENKKGDY